MSKALFYIENYVFGGANKYFVDIINASLSVFDEIVVTYNPGGFFPEDKLRIQRPLEFRELNVVTRDQFKIAGIPKLLNAYRYFLVPLIYWVNKKKFKKILSEENPDYVIACNGGYPGAESVLAIIEVSGKMKIKNLLSIVSVPAPSRKYLFLGFYDNYLDHKMNKYCDKIVMNSHLQLQVIKDLRRIIKPAQFCVYNGVKDKNLPHKGISDKFVVGFSGRIERSKGVVVLVEAIIPLFNIHPNLQLLIVGDGPDIVYLKDKLKTLGFSDRVIFTGFVQKISSYYEQMDLYVFPSFWEGVPYAILEALRAGLPIIASNVGGIPEVIRDGIDGVLVPPGQVEYLERQIHEMIQDQSKLRMLSLNARKRFVSTFTLEKMNEAFTHALNN